MQYVLLFLIGIFLIDVGLNSNLGSVLAAFVDAGALVETS